jgi:ribosomal protein S27E
MSPDFIEMSGETIGNLQVVDYAKVRARRAYWWVLCLECQHQQAERGTNLRKAQRGAFTIRCKGCGA